MKSKPSVDPERYLIQVLGKYQIPLEKKINKTLVQKDYNRHCRLCLSTKLYSLEQHNVQGGESVLLFPDPHGEAPTVHGAHGRAKYHPLAGGARRGQAHEVTTWEGFGVNLEN